MWVVQRAKQLCMPALASWVRTRACVSTGSAVVLARRSKWLFGMCLIDKSNEGEEEMMVRGLAG